MPAKKSTASRRFVFQALPTAGHGNVRAQKILFFLGVKHLDLWRDFPVSSAVPCRTEIQFAAESRTYLFLCPA